MGNPMNRLISFFSSRYKRWQEIRIRMRLDKIHNDAIKVAAKNLCDHIDNEILQAVYRDADNSLRKDWLHPVGKCSDKVRIDLEKKYSQKGAAGEVIH